MIFISYKKNFNLDSSEPNIIRLYYKWQLYFLLKEKIQVKSLIHHTIYLLILYLQDLVQFSESNAVFQLANQPSVTTYQIRYVCPYCSKSFFSEDYMQIHINEHHNFICNICNLRLYSFNDLNLHKIQHTLL